MAYEETPYSITDHSPWWLRGLAIFMSIMCIGMLAQVGSGLLTPIYLELIPEDYSEIEPYPKDGTQEDIDNWTANEIFWSQTIEYLNGLENMLFYSVVYGIMLFLIGLISIPVLWSGNRELGLKITSIWFFIYLISQVHLISMLYLDVGFFPDYDFGAEADRAVMPDFIESISLLVSVVQILFCNTILFAFLALVFSKTKKKTNFDIPSGFHKSPPSQD
jgi:hypothetical protein